MKWLRFSILAIICTLLQASIFSRLRVRIDIMLIVLVFAAIFFDLREAIIASFVIGFLADLVGQQMGANTIVFGLIGSALATMHRFIQIRLWAYQVLAIFIVGIITSFLGYWLASLKTGVYISDTAGTIFLTAFCSAIVGPFLFKPFAWWLGVRPGRRRKR